MAEKRNRQQLADQADVRAVPDRAPTQVDRTFELPASLYKVTVGLFLAFIALMAASFPNMELVIPMVIFAFFIIAGFGIPTIWATMHPDHPEKPKSWSRFQADGIQTGTGKTSASAATVQVLILPVLIFLWGVAAVSIAALVR